MFCRTDKLCGIYVSDKEEFLPSDGTAHSQIHKNRFASGVCETGTSAFCNEEMQSDETKAPESN